MADQATTQQAFAIVETMSDLKGYPYGKKAISGLVTGLLRAAGGDIEKLGRAVEHFRSEVDSPHVPTQGEVKTFLYVQLERLDAATRIKVIKQGGDNCPKCGNDGRYIAEGWKKDPLKPEIPPDYERGRPGRPQGRRWTSWAEWCGCAIGKIRQNLHKSSRLKAGAT